MRLSKKITKRFNIPNDPDKGWVELKHLRPNQEQEVTSDLNDVSYQPGSTHSLSVKMNPYVRKKKLAHESIISWGNIFDTLGVPLEYTGINLDKAAEFIIYVEDEEFSFYDWIEQCRESLSAEVKKDMQAALEN